MHRIRPLQTSSNICWQCQWRLNNQGPRFALRISPKCLLAVQSSWLPQRAYHATSINDQAALEPIYPVPAFNPALIPRPPQLSIREHLQQWQNEHGGPTEEVLAAFENHPANKEVHNGMSKLHSGFKADEGLDTEDQGQTDYDEGDELITIGLFLKPGDVVELSQAGREPVLAVFVQQVDSSSQFFSVNGRWSHSILARVAFAIPGCIDPVLLTPLIPFLPTSLSQADPKGEVHVPVEIGIPVQRILERMTAEAERIYRANAPVLDTAYAVLADPNRTRMMTLTQIAKTLLAPKDPGWMPSPAALLAVRKSLNHNEFRFKSDRRSHRLTNVFAIRPKNDVQTVETVLEWIREHREFLAASATRSSDDVPTPSKGAKHVIDFLEKARRLITISRKDREPNFGVLGPSKARMSKTEEFSGLQSTWGESFTNSDSQIINFLQAWVLTTQFVGMAGLYSACTNLVMATGCYGKDVYQARGTPDELLGEIRRHTGLLLLQEIGVITPFENRHLYDEQLMLPTVRLSRNLELLNTKAELIRRSPDFQDTMAGLRRDWGTTTVFCIDDAGANEIDDGVSIERVPGDASEFWIHVHVANPTAFFDKTHTLSGLAAHRTETVYTPEKSFPMLPTWATQGFFSLKPNRPVLTFSSRINGNGRVLETKIQPGTIRKIVSITPSHLSTLLGHKPSFETRKFVVGAEKVPDEPGPRTPRLSASETQDLKDLYTAAQNLWSARRAAGGMRFDNAANTVRVFERPDRAGVTWNPPSTGRSRLVTGDPIIEVTSRIPRSFANFGITPENIIEEMMMLACSSVASWCSDRKIPVMYRGTIDTPQYNGMSVEELRTKHLLPYVEKNVEVPRGLALRYREALGRAIAHSAPIPHKAIGVPAYVKVTSPLRRFSDMIAHWQIEAAIRYEAHTGKKFNAPESATDPRGVLPFTQRQMQESIVTLSPRERIIASTKKSSSRFWGIMALLRAWQYNEASVPDVLRFWVRKGRDQLTASKSGAQGLLLDYGYPASFEDTTIDGRMGDEWEVTIDRIDVFSTRVHVKPVRLVHRDEEFT
ncbi:hypothetical protein FB567DRAFT_238295 [Paraphoma chrysanthemicola]|uniref:RNB domain-containing protein n=1 Tax=Paraphoma chrysanthemicola TaxID=798071 RepID=A0A8K0RH07_9PLEO|nr:hypothetical protein FB567DRAFT_238295 [Paraphoma chrysanthemicola]